MTKVPMTIRGAELLREELKKLKSDDRPKVIQAIARPRLHVPGQQVLGLRDARGAR